MRFFSRVENTQPRIAGGLKDDVRPAFDLRLRKLFAFSGVVPRRVGYSNVVLEYFDLRVRIASAFSVAGFELMNQRNVHSPDKSHLPGLARARGNHSHQEGSFVLFEDQRRDIWRINHAVDDRELQVGIVARYVIHDRSLSETDPDDQVVAAFGEGSHRGFD